MSKFIKKINHKSNYNFVALCCVILYYVDKILSLKSINLWFIVKCIHLRALFSICWCKIKTQLYTIKESLNY